jgi:hypothetical protein
VLELLFSSSNLGQINGVNAFGMVSTDLFDTFFAFF